MLCDEDGNQENLFEITKCYGMVTYYDIVYYIPISII